jgi:hypothetical protein
MRVTTEQLAFERAADHIFRTRLGQKQLPRVSEEHCPCGSATNPTVKHALPRFCIRLYFFIPFLCPLFCLLIQYELLIDSIAPSCLSFSISRDLPTYHVPTPNETINFGFFMLAEPWNFIEIPSLRVVPFLPKSRHGQAGAALLNLFPPYPSHSRSNYELPT